MSIERNKTIDRRYVEEVIDRGDVDVIDEICAENYTSHVPGMPPMDRDGDKQLIGMIHRAFPDLRCTMEDQIAEGDRVVHRLRVRGTHRGEFQGVPASGATVEVEGININQIVDGRIVASWGVLDLLGLMQQIGAIPTPER